MFGSIKTAIVEYFDVRYVALSEADATAAATTAVAAVEIGFGRAFYYRVFDSMKPPTFYGVWDLIIAMRCFSNIERCFFT